MVQHNKEPQLQFHLKVMYFSNGAFGGRKVISNKKTTVNEEVDRWASRMAQMLMSDCPSQREVQNQTTSHLNHKWDLPLRVAYCLTRHGSVCSQWLWQFVHGLGCRTDDKTSGAIWKQTLLSILRWIHENSGVYSSPDTEKKFIHCAADNLDFSEKTTDGKRALLSRNKGLWPCHTTLNNWIKGMFIKNVWEGIANFAILFKSGQLEHLCSASGLPSQIVLFYFFALNSWIMYGWFPCNLLKYIL